MSKIPPPRVELSPVGQSGERHGSPLVHSTSDSAVQATAGDAFSSKKAITELGYIKDDWLSCFSHHQRSGISPRPGFSRPSPPLGHVGLPGSSSTSGSTVLGSSGNSHTPSSFFRQHHHPPSLQDFTPSAPSSSSHPSPTALAPSERKDPVFNRGTFVRVQGIRQLIDSFLASVGGAKAQVVSIGCGMDTLGFDYQSKGRVHKWFDVDFPEITASKTRTIWTSPTLRSALTEPATLAKSGTSLNSTRYAVCPADVRHPETTLATLVELADFVEGAPTLFLFECVLVYMSKEEASTILKQCLQWTSPGIVGVLLFEHLDVVDSWGSMMRVNLAKRDIALEAMLTESQHKERLASLGYQHSSTIDMHTAFEHWISAEEKTRIHEIEALDELEEWECMSKHYGFIWAYSAQGGGEDGDATLADPLVSWIRPF